MNKLPPTPRAVNHAGKTPQITVSGCGVLLPRDPGGYYCEACTRGEPCPVDAEQVAICRVWLRHHARPLKTVSNSRSSYNYKHDVEEWLEHKQGLRSYVANGAFIAAAQAEGYRVRSVGINALFDFNVPVKRRLGVRIPLASLARDLEQVLGAAGGAL